MTGQEEIEATCYSLAERLDNMRNVGQEVSKCENCVWAGIRER